MLRKKILCIILCIALVTMAGCKLENDTPTLNESLEGIRVPQQYTIEQRENNSGFAGAPSTGQYYFDVNFTVQDEKVDEGMYDYLTISELKAKISTMGFADPGIDIGNNTRCFLHEQWGVQTAIVCFSDSMPVYFILKEYKGNHQSNELEWKFEDYQIPTYPECADSRDDFCDVMHAAVKEDAKVCNRLTIAKNSCIQIANS